VEAKASEHAACGDWRLARELREQRGREMQREGNCEEEGAGRKSDFVQYRGGGLGIVGGAAIVP
jgi:hypothetical protein